MTWQKKLVEELGGDGGGELGLVGIAERGGLRRHVEVHNKRTTRCNACCGLGEVLSRQKGLVGMGWDGGAMCTQQDTMRVALLVRGRVEVVGRGTRGENCVLHCGHRRTAEPRPSTQHAHNGMHCVLRCGLGGD